MIVKIKEAFAQTRIIIAEVENVVLAARKVAARAQHSEKCRMGVGDPTSLCDCGVEELRRALDKMEFALDGYRR